MQFIRCFNIGLKKLELSSFNHFQVIFFLIESTSKSYSAFQDACVTIFLYCSGLISLTQCSNYLLRLQYRKPKPFLNLLFSTISLSLGLILA